MRAVLFFATAWCLWVPNGVAADDVHIEAATTFQAYEVRSPGTSVFFARRRLVQELSMSWTDRLGPESEGVESRFPWLHTQVTLRFGQDFGHTCLLSADLCYRATERSESGSFQPLAADTALDAPIAYAQIDRLPWRSRFRLGRQLVWDSTGFVRVDGGSVSTRPVDWLSLEPFGGMVVRQTSFAGADAFVPQGGLHLDLNEEDRARFGFIDEPRTTWVTGGSIRAQWARLLRGRVAAREVWDESGVIARRFGAGVSSEPISGLMLQADGVWDLLGDQLADAEGSVTLAFSDVDVLVRMERHVPVFDAGTIWAYFDVAPITEGSVGARWTPTRKVALGTAVHGRLAELDDEGDVHDVGVEAYGRARIGSYRFGLSGFSWGGGLGPLAAVSADASRRIAQGVRLEGRASVWHFDDPLREGLYGTSLSESLSLRWELSELSVLRFEIEHATSRVVGHRLRALAWFSFEVWR